MELFESMTVATLVKIITALIASISSISAGAIYIYKWVEKYRRIRNESEYKDKIIKKTIQDVENLKADMSDIIAKVDNLVSMLEIEQDKRKKRERARFKKDIKEIYQKCNSTKTISHMDLNTLEDLIAEYEEADGKNSFVHTVVQQEMYTWKEVDD